MDDRIKKALDFSNYRVTLFNLKENLKVKVDSMLTHAVNGGLFKVTPELITFVKDVADTGITPVVLIDSNDNPVSIDDPKALHGDMLDKYFQATNYYHVEYMKIRKARSVREQFEEIIKE